MTEKTSIPLPQFEQYECRNETLEVYASDRRGQVSYTFNNLGYRNSIDYVDHQQPIGVYIGSSITSGIGLEWSSSFAYLSAGRLGVEPWHFSQGCVRLSNQQNLETITALKNSGLNIKYWVVQFIDLDRATPDDLTEHSEIIAQFYQTFNQIEQLLQDQIWCFVGCDKNNYDIGSQIRNHHRCVGWNVPFVDRAGVGEHPGAKWHRMIAAGIEKSLLNQLQKS